MSSDLSIQDFTVLLNRPVLQGPVSAINHPNILVLYCRFLSIGEQLACYCGFPRCRGVVNDVEAEEQVAKLYVSRNQLIDWRGE